MPSNTGRNPDEICQLGTAAFAAFKPVGWQAFTAPADGGPDLCFT